MSSSFVGWKIIDGGYRAYSSFLKDDALIMNKEGSIRFPAHCEGKLYERYITIVHSDEVNVTLETSKLYVVAPTVFGCLNF